MFKKILTSSLLTLVAFGGFFWVSLEQWEHTTRIEVASTYAASGDTNNKAAATEDADMKKMLNSLVAWINIILDIVTIFVTPAIMLASWLMSPDWTAGDLFGIRPTLHNLWITVSNITYFVYAILLIFIAIATIFNSEHYGYKAMLPKLALGIILVPLTWWGVQFTVSVATYITAAAISIPYESISKFSEKDAWWTTPSIPKNNEYDNDKSKDNKTAENTKCPANCISPEQFVKKSWWLFSPLVIYGFSVFKIQEVKKINTVSDTATSVFNIINQGIVGALMFLVYGLLVLALIFMLMMRAMKLWFYAIFSPLFTIKYVLGDKWFGDADKDGSFKITEFIGLAFVPAVVSLALWFGLIIVSALISPMNGSKNNDNKCTGTTCTIVIMWNKENTIETKDEKTDKWTITTTKVSIGWVSYTWKWSVSASEWTTAGIKSALWATGNIFGTVVIDILALVFIWVAFMAGKWVSKAAGKAIEPFEAMGNKIWQLGMSLPKYTPIPWLPWWSIAGMWKAVDLSQNALHEASNKRFEESAAGKFFGANKYIPEDTDKKIVQDLKNINRTSIDDIRQKGSAGVFAKENAYMSESIKELANILKDPSKREQFLKEATHLSDEQRRQFRDFQDKPDNDENRKKLAALMNSTFWTATSTWAATTNVIGSATRDAWGNGNNVMITLSGTPITIQNKKNDNNITIDTKNLEALKDKKWVMTKDELIAELKKQMSPEAAKKVVDEIESKHKDFFKK